MSTSLERCVGDARLFERDHWAKAPLLRKADPTAPFPFREIAELGDLDHMVTSLGLRTPNFRMVKNGKPLAEAGYTKTHKKRGGATDPVIDPAAVFHRFDEGATIVLESLHRYWRPLAVFARGLEVELGHRVQVNAYITPPGSQGFALHSDDHDVFVLQIAGSKRWTVNDREDPSRALLEEVLDRGDALYIPTGFPHAANTVEHMSAHLTVGILTYDESDVVREIVKMAEEGGAFDGRLPLRSAADPAGLRSITAAVKDELVAWIGKLDDDDLDWRLRRRLSTTQQELLGGQLERLRSLDQLDDTSLVRRRELTICSLRRTGDRLHVLLSDRELEMPATAQDAMQFVASRDSFTLSELDGWLDAESRKVLVRRLVKEGLLEVVLDG